jgi:acetyl/propionyl-CoA carboxylase alpha subunit
VDVHYDPLLAKVIAWGRDRAESIARLRTALARFVILGVTTNIDFLQDVLAHPEFAAGRTDTAFLDRHELPGVSAPPVAAWVAAALSAGDRHASAGTQAGRAHGVATPWADAGRWRVAEGRSAG